MQNNITKTKITWKINEITNAGQVKIKFDQNMNNSINLNYINETNTNIFVLPANKR